jgi:flagellar protein FlaJ
MSSASTETSTGGGRLETIDAVTDLRDAYDEMPMSNRRYLLLIVVPAFALAGLLVVGSIVLPISPLVVVPMVLLGGLMVLSAVAYPRLYVEQWSREIENEFHLLVTHMTVLSTTNIDRMEVFRTVSKQEEYGAIAEEVRRVTELVDTWNQSLDDACRRRAREVPSEALGDYFDRLAYSLGAGQELGDFLLNEQEVIMEEFATLYRGALNNLDVLKDLYLSMVLSMTFGLVFAVVLPILTGTNPTYTVTAVIVLYMFVQVGFFVALRAVTPNDPVWYHPENASVRLDTWAIVALAVSTALSLALFGIVAGDLFGFLPVDLATLLGVGGIPLPLYAALPTAPLLLPGIVVRIEENRIKERDEEFPSFIRALGASESAKQSTSTAVLEDLRKKDFGPLTETMDNLYRRLNMRVDPDTAWDLFGVEARSYLIQKFSDMYCEGRNMGGEPKKLGELISENVNKVLQLRERRTQETITLIGLLYGITAASTFAFFIGLAVVDILSGLSFGLESATSQFDFAQLINTESYDIPVIEFLLTTIILFNAALSSLMIRTVDGGNKITSLYHFTALTWIGSLIAVGTKVLTEVLINV